MAHYYIVSFSVIVDFPERRDASFVPVRPGTTVLTKKEFLKHSEAVSFFNGLLDGEWDFGSEYVYRASCYRMDAWSDNHGSAPTVRKEVRRCRKADGKVVIENGS